MSGGWTKGVCSAHCCDAVPTPDDDGRRFVDIFVGEVILSPFDEAASGNIVLGDRIAFLWAESHRIEERDANAALITEAFNVANETGLPPRQLADQRAELLAACKSVIPANMSLTNKNIPDDTVVPLETTMGALRKIAAVIAKATGAA